MVKQVVFLLLLLVPIVAATEIESESFYVQSTHIGLSGYQGESTTYDSRATLTFQQGASGETGSATYTYDVGHFEPLDIEPPTVEYITPFEGQSLASSPIVPFTFNATDNNEVTNCELFINDVYTSNDTSITNGFPNTIQVNLVNGDYTYYVLCYDPSGNNNSIVRTNFTLNYQAGGGGSINTVAPPSPLEGPINNSLIDFISSREARPKFRADDLKLVAFLGLLWAAWYLFIFRGAPPDKPKKTVYIR